MHSLPDPTARAWFESRTFTSPGIDLDAMTRIKRSSGVRVSVCLPARNESATIASICRLIQTELVEESALVDEMIVVDSGSTDDTMGLARATGARVYAAAEILEDRYPEVHGGKGESLWKSLAVVDDNTDVIVWLDSDTRNFSTRFVTALIMPFLEDPSLMMTKAFYDRPLASSEGVLANGGARVTELAIRPLINLFYPELSGVVQPLSGEYALRKTVAMQLPFFTGYGVDIGLLLDVCEKCGLNAIAQVDLGTRVHRNRDTLELGRTAYEVMRALLRRLEDAGRIKLPPVLPDTLTQFSPGDGGPEVRSYPLRVDELEPMQSVLGASKEL